jgi:hypothetical protein
MKRCPRCFYTPPTDKLILAPNRVSSALALEIKSQLQPLSNTDRMRVLHELYSVIVGTMEALETSNEL